MPAKKRKPSIEKTLKENQSAGGAIDPKTFFAPGEQGPEVFVPDKTKPQNCITCKHFDSSAMECHRNPPHVYFAYGEKTSAWPKVMQGGWCSEYEGG